MKVEKCKKLYEILLFITSNLKVDFKVFFSKKFNEFIKVSKQKFQWVQVHTKL